MAGRCGMSSIGIAVIRLYILADWLVFRECQSAESCRDGSALAWLYWLGLASRHIGASSDRTDATSSGY